MTDLQPGHFEVPVLLVAPNWLGDAVMFSSLIEYLHRNRKLSNGRILKLELAVRENWAPIFRNDDRLRQIHLVKKNGRHGGLSGGWKLGNDFRAMKPEAVLLGPPSFRAGLAARRSGARIRVGYRNDGRSALLTHSLNTPVRGKNHHSVELVELGALLLKSLNEPQPEVDAGAIYPTLPGCQSIPAEESESSAPLWVFAPGATYGSAKSWPLVRALDYVKEAIREIGVRLVLLGDSSATVFARELSQELGVSLSESLDGGPGLVDLTGKTDLNRVVSILKASQVFVGNDSGLMHLSAALEVPTVGIFGSSNPSWTSPKGPFTRVVNAEGFSCWPCYLKECNQKEFCLDTISSRMVLTAIDDLLKRNEI